LPLIFPDKPRLSLQRLRRTKVGTNTLSSQRGALPSSSRGSVGGPGALEKAIFHGDEVGNGNDNESRASSSYGIRTLFSHLHTSASIDQPAIQIKERLERNYTKEELRVGEKRMSEKKKEEHILGGI
jgi:hypothetical protein